MVLITSAAVGSLLCLMYESRSVDYCTAVAVREVGVTTAQPPVTDETTTTPQVQQVQNEQQDQGPEYQRLTDVVHDRADADGYIVLAMTDEAFLDMAINFH